MLRYISILGSTGSIGTQTLDVVRNLTNVRVAGLTTNENIELLEQQIYEFKPRLAVVMNEKKAQQLQAKLAGMAITVLSGMEGLIAAATMEEISTVVTSVVGNVGLQPTFAAIEAGKDIALANKETLVSAGQLIIEAAKAKQVNIYPVDSEHSAIFQCLQGNEGNAVSRLLLTASGGPFRGRSREDLAKVTVADALKHPNWSMGRKITIDSATLMNKGLEVIEAKWLFDVDIDQIEVLVHPQSIVHSAVEYADNSIIAQMGEHDMRVPIQYALTYPARVVSQYPKVDFAVRSQLTFEQPDVETFRCLQLAYKAIAKGGTMCAVLNAANEIAVERFLREEISFLEIATLIEAVMDAHTVIAEYTLADLLAVDQWARAYAANLSLA